MICNSRNNAGVIPIPRWMTLFPIISLFFPYFFPSPAISQNVIIVVIDGPRYSETFGAGTTYIPKIQELVALGTLFSNFRNDSLTYTNPGHAAILTGVWQPLLNDGSQLPFKPTLFEYFRKEKYSPLSDNMVVAGKAKLDILTHSTHPDYGVEYRASFILGINDKSVYDSLLVAMTSIQPRLVLVNFPSVDLVAHSGSYPNYLNAIKSVDSIVYDLWQTIQAMDFYKDSTALFVTADHGRHTDANGGFANHGDDCEGCRHIFLLALGPGIPSGVIRDEVASQIDLAPTAAAFLGISLPHATGRNLFEGSIVKADPVASQIESFELRQNIPNPFNPTTKITYVIPTGASIHLEIFDVLGKRVYQEERRNQSAGFHEIVWNGIGSFGNRLSSGVYLYRLTATFVSNERKLIQTKKMVLIK